MFRIPTIITLGGIMTRGGVIHTAGGDSAIITTAIATVSLLL